MSAATQQQHEAEEAATSPLAPYLPPALTDAQQQIWDDDVTSDKKILMAFYKKVQPSTANDEKIWRVIRTFKKSAMNSKNPEKSNWRETMYSAFMDTRNIDPRDLCPELDTRRQPSVFSIEYDGEAEADEEEGEREEEKDEENDAGVGGKRKPPSNTLRRQAKKQNTGSAATASTEPVVNAFNVGDMVDVDRKWARDGGTGKVTNVSGGKYTVKYVMGGTERNLPEEALKFSQLG